MAQLGFRKLEDAIGQVELLDTKSAIDHWKASGLDLAPLLIAPRDESPRRNVTKQDHGLVNALDNELIKLSAESLNKATPTRLNMKVRNVNRTVGTMLGAEITRRFGGRSTNRHNRYNFPWFSWTIIWCFFTLWFNS